MNISGKTALFCLLLFAGCARPALLKSPDISGISGAFITRKVALPHVSSGSSLALDGQTLYLLSDDAPYVYTYSLKTGQTDSLWLSYLNSRDHRIVHTQKPDYEASFFTEKDGRKCLVFFGSGTRSPTRDFIGVLWLDAPQKPERYDATAFYAHLRKAGNIPAKDFNIEGAARTPDGEILLLNRGRQEYFHFPENAFWEWIENQALPVVSVKNAPLPNAAPYTFSGIETLDENTLVFTASQEATRSATTDGKVLGSAVGFLRKDNAGNWKSIGLWPVQDISGKTASEKLEGIVSDPTARNFRKFIALTDNDDGESKLLWVELR